jgi:hypothetical protein
MCAISTKKKRAHGLGGFADALEIDDPGISAGSRNDHFWFVLGGESFNFVVVDALVFLFHAIGDKFIHAAGEIQRMPVRQVAAMRKIHAKDYVVLLQRGHIDRHVGRSARMRLHIGMLCAEEFLGAIDGELLDLVSVLAAAVIAPSRIAFGVFVGEDGAHGFEDRLGDKVLRGDEFQTCGLASGFVAKEVRNLRIDSVKRAIHAVIGVCGLAHGDSSIARAI